MLSISLDNQNDQARERWLEPMENDNQWLKERVQEYELFMDHHPDGCLILQEGLIVYLNKKAHQLLNCQNTDPIIGKTFKDFLSFDNQIWVGKDANSEEGENLRPYFTIFSKDGQRRLNFLLISSSISYESKMTVYYLIKEAQAEDPFCQTNLSSERQSQEQHHYAEKLANMSMLVGKICHEINNFLTGIICTAGIMGNQFEGNDSFASLIREGERMKKLVQSLSTLSRPSPKKLADISFEDLLETTLSLAGNVVKSMADYKIEKEYSPNPTMISGDAHQLVQVFLNLIINAAQAMQSKQNQGVLTISTKISPDGKYGVGLVQDNGCGIAREDQSKIFEPFYTTKEEGTGLGLPIIKEIVENHHGLITFESKENHGTCFRVLLPLA